MKKYFYFNRGFGLVEVVISVSIISLSILGVMLVAQLSQKVIGESTKKVQAAFLAEEGIEAVKSMRDRSWQTDISLLNVGSDYYISFNGTAWVSTTTNAYLNNIFERKFVVNNVYRNVSDDIAESGALDPDTKKITVSVSWFNRNSTTTNSISTYIANLYSN
ncbi:MAG: prepilin-type N-terminal cleavage/methylation domain-containing protein [Patescibacteria group bacterium]